MEKEKGVISISIEDDHPKSLRMDSTSSNENETKFNRIDFEEKESLLDYDSEDTSSTPKCTWDYIWSEIKWYSKYIIPIVGANVVIVGGLLTYFLLKR